MKLEELENDELLKLEAQMTKLQDCMDDTWKVITETVGRNADNKLVNKFDLDGDMNEAVLIVLNEVARRLNNGDLDARHLLRNLLEEGYNLREVETAAISLYEQGKINGSYLKEIAKIKSEKAKTEADEGEKR